MFTPVRQTIFGKPKGNCFAACIASILGISLSSIPDLNEPDIGHQTENAIKFLNQYGLTLVEFKPGVTFWDFRNSPYLIASGLSPRANGDPEFRHGVIVKDGKFIHDPHPSDDFLYGDVTDYILICPINNVGITMYLVASIYPDVNSVSSETTYTGD